MTVSDLSVIGVQSVVSRGTAIRPEDILLCSGKVVAIDTETTGLDWWRDKLLGVGIHCPTAGVSGYIHTVYPDVKRKVLECIHSLGKDTYVIMHNAKFDCHFLNVVPDELGWNIIDTTVLVHLLDSRTKKSLGYVESLYLGTKSKREFTENIAKGKKIWQMSPSIVAKYCHNDTIVTHQLAEILIPKVVSMGLWTLFQKDMKYLSTLHRIETIGVQYDRKFSENAFDLLQNHMLSLEEKLYDSVGYKFNWRSPQQLSKAIYTDMGIPKPKNPFADADGVDRSRFADSGKYKSTCTSTFILTEKVHHPLGDLVSSLREALKLMNYVKKWGELADDDDVLHTNFNITGTRTGRLSSSKPNLQNVPSEVRGRFTQSVFSGSIMRTDEYNLRKAIVARPGKIFLSIDYKQMEIRMFGLISQDPFMLKSLASGSDIHLDIAKEVWGDCGYATNMIHREWSKTISFGLIYGMTVGSLMYKLNMDIKRAKEVTNQYWHTFPRIQPWLKEVVDECKQNGFVKYWSGRIWREDNVIDMYKGANAVIQGGCADLISIAAIRVDEWCRKQGRNDYHIISIVHDELILEVPEEDVDRCSDEVGALMRVPDLLDIPFVTEPKTGKDYGSLSKSLHKEVENPFDNTIDGEFIEDGDTEIAE